jgi:cytochrome c
MIRFQTTGFIAIIIFCLAACTHKKPAKIQRPRDPWAFRSVLDKKPRMLTLALDSACYVAYDLAHCTLYKAWKGGVMLEGAAYTNKKNVQPTTWGTAYYDDIVQHSKWIAEFNGKQDSSRVVSKGYLFQDDQIYLKYLLILSRGDTIHIEERPEFVRSKTGQPGLERSFKVSGMPDGVTVFLEARDTSFALNAKRQNALITYFNPLPSQSPPRAEEEYDSRGRYWMEKSDCFTCHELDKKTVGPSFRQIAQRYENETSPDEHLIPKIKEGGSGVWGSSLMNAHPNLTESEIKTMLVYILSLKSGNKKENNLMPEVKKMPDKNLKPGFGKELEGIHPSYDVSTIHKYDFKPRVGAWLFCPTVVYWLQPGIPSVEFIL